MMLTFIYVVSRLTISSNTTVTASIRSRIVRRIDYPTRKWNVVLLQDRSNLEIVESTRVNGFDFSCDSSSEGQLDRHSA